MSENLILTQLQILKAQFESYWSNWSKLGQEREFTSLPHSSSIRDMFAEGKSITDYLAGSLETNDVGKYTLLNDYVDRVQDSITPYKEYERIGKAAHQEYQEKFHDNYTVGIMLRIYTAQAQHIGQVERLLDQLRATTTYRMLVDLPPNASPMQVIAAWAKMWEGDAQLHRDLDEVGLRAQLTAALRHAGFNAISEGHAYQGHADIVVLPELQSMSGNELVVECKIWHGESAFEDAATQLCRYVTPNDRHAALIVFVRNISFQDIIEKAKKTLEEHICFDRWINKGYSEGQFALCPAQNPHVTIPATLLLCNLAITRY